MPYEPSGNVALKTKIAPFDREIRNGCLTAPLVRFWGYDSYKLSLTEDLAVCRSRLYSPWCSEWRFL